MTPELQGLREVSARLGSDPLLVQGGGGNASLKEGGILHVKSSGTWMSDALKRDIFVSLDLAGVRKGVKAGEEDFSSLVLPSAQGDGRPSIETALHAIMPHAVVIHAHAVNSICTTLLPSAVERLTQKLGGIRWAIVPYAKPGADLARAIQDVLEADAPDVVFMSNHGVVAGGASAREVEERLRDVESRLSFDQTVSSQPAVQADRPDVAGYRWHDDAGLGALACDPSRAQKLCRRALVPDQVVYLGGPAVWSETVEDLSDIRAEWLRSRGVEPRLVFVSGLGALVHEDVGSGGMSMIFLLGEIAHRLPITVVPSMLSVEDELKLLNWDAEKYRQALDAQRGSAGN